MTNVLLFAVNDEENPLCELFITGRKARPPPPPHFLFSFLFKSKFNFSQTVGEMVFVSFEVEKMRMFLVKSVVRWYCVLVRSWVAVVSFPV